MNEYRWISKKQPGEFVSASKPSRTRPTHNTTTPQHPNNHTSPVSTVDRNNQTDRQEDGEVLPLVTRHSIDPGGLHKSRVSYHTRTHAHTHTSTTPHISHRHNSPTVTNTWAFNQLSQPSQGFGVSVVCGGWDGREDTSGHHEGSGMGWVRHIEKGYSEASVWTENYVMAGDWNVVNLFIPIRGKCLSKSTMCCTRLNTGDVHL